jgi:hypothetical protein
VATKKYWITIQPAVTPLWGSVMSEAAGIPAANTTAYGWQVAKTALTTPYFRGRIGAATFAAAAQAASFIDAQTGPQKGTSTSNTTAADCFRSPTPVTGVLAAGNWTFNFAMRTSVVQHSGRARCIVWASTADDGSVSPRKLSSTAIVCSTIAAAALNTTYTSAGTWAAPAITLNNEYLFFSVEWQVTAIGTSNTTNIFFRQSEAYIETTDLAVPTADAWNVIDKTASVTLTSSDKTAASSSPGQGVRSTTARTNTTAGKYYVEFVTGNVTLQNVGLRLGSEAIGSAATQTANVFLDTGAINVGASNVGSVGSKVATGEILCQAWDSGAEKIWFRRNNGLWNNDPAANPATGVNGIDVSSFTNSVNFNLWVYGGSIGGMSSTVRTEIADLTYSVPAGFTSWMGEAVPTANAWNVNDKEAGVTLSNSDKLATGIGTARGTKIWSVGGSEKLYAELVVTAMTGSAGFTLGVASTANPLNNPFGSQNFSVTSSGLIIANGSVVGSGYPLLALGDVLGLAYDIPAQRGWVRLNNLNWNNDPTANPATGTGGLVATGMTGSIALIRVANEAPTGITIRTQVSDFTKPVPTGFISWMGESLGPPPDVCVATPYVDSPPIVDAGTIGQTHVWASTSFSVSALGLPAGVLKQEHALSAPLTATSGLPVFGTANLTVQINIPAATPLAVAAPTIGAATFQQKHVLPIATALAVPQPTITSAAFGQAHALPAAIPLAVQPPAFVTGTLKQVHAIAATALAPIAPTLNAPTLGLTSLLSASNLATAPPVEAAALFAQKNALAALAVAVNPPAITAGTLAQAHTFTAIALAVTPPLIATSSIGQAGALAAIPAVAGVPVISVPALGQKQVLTAPNLNINVPVVLDAIAEGASVHVDLVGVTGYVRGVGSVGVNTLIGKDPNSDFILGSSAYYPEGQTQYGYDYNNDAAGAAGGYSPAFIGALRSAVMSGKSVVIKFQSTGSIHNNNVFQIYINAVQSFNGVYVESYGGSESVGLDAGDNAGAWFELDAAAFHRVPQGVAGIVNAIGFNAITANRLDYACNNFDAQTTPLVDTGEALAVGIINTYGAIASITTFDTLSLADLKAKTVPKLYGGAATGEQMLGVGTLSTTYRFTANGLAGAPPVIGTATLKQTHKNIGVAVSVGAPALGVPAFAQSYILAAPSLAVGPPLLSTAAIAAISNVSTLGLVTSSPALGAPALGQRHIFVGSSITVAPLIDSGVLGQAGVLGGLPASAGSPIIGLGVFGQKHVLPLATSATAGAPVFAAGTFGQQHLIAAINSAINPATFGVCVFGQKHVLNATPLTVLVPAIPAATLGQAGVMAAIPIEVASPAIGVPAIGQKYVAAAQGLTVGPPALDATSLGKVLQATALAVGAPVISPPLLTKVLTAAPLSIGIPAIGIPTCALRVFDLTASGLAIGPPTIPVLTIGQSGVMAAVPLSVGAPVLGAPALALQHVLSTAGVTVGSPLLGAPAIAVRVNATADALTGAAPVLGQATLGQTHKLIAIGCTVASPSLPQVTLGAVGVMAAVPLAIGVPTFSVPTFKLNIVAVGALPLAVGAPALGSAVLGQEHRLIAQAASAGRPVMGAGNVGQAGVMAAIPLWVGSPILPILALHERQRFTGNGFTVGPPFLGIGALGITVRLPRPQSTFAGRFRPDPAVLGQVHGLNARAASAGAPTGLVATLAIPQVLTAEGFEVGAPGIGAPLFAPRDRLLAVVDITSRQRLTPIIGRRPSVMISNTQHAAPLTGERNSRATIIGRRDRNVI